MVGHRIDFIAGLSAGALAASWVMKGAMESKAFAAWIEQVRIPELEPGPVFIPGPLAAYRNDRAAKAMRNAGGGGLFLPPRSPDLNPIESAFPKRKAHPRRIGARPSQTCSTPSPISAHFSWQKSAGTPPRPPRYVAGEQPGA